MSTSATGSFAEGGGWPEVLSAVIDGRSLTGAEAAQVMAEILQGRAEAAQIAALLVALRIKGETVDEISGLVAAMMEHAVPLKVAGEVMDLVGTGGDRLSSINVTTLAALITAGAGVPVCKHGGRAASSSVGTADVLEALGVRVDVGPHGVLACLGEAGMGFCLAPRFHPAMRHAAPVRRQLGVPTIFNFLGPLTNPAGARYRLVGVSDPAMAEKMATVLGRNGCRRALVAWADDGLDELSVTAPSHMVEVIGDGDGDFELARSTLDGRALGFPPRQMSELRGGDARWNAGVIHRVLQGEQGAARDIGVLNAAAALTVFGAASDYEEGIALATTSVDGGDAAQVLERLVAVSAAVAEDDGQLAKSPPA